MTPAPWAEVVAVRGPTATIRCPYCGQEHAHQVSARGRTEHRAPGCGLYRSGENRAAGYRFTTPEEGRHHHD